MDLGLEGKRALVCGASAGLGFAAAEALAAEGVGLAINSRDRGRLESAADNIYQKTGMKPGLAVGDLSKSADRVKVVSAARKHLKDGSIDILISNTGGPPPGQFLEHSGEKWSEAHHLVLESALGLTRALLPDMLERKWGRLIYITSVGVLQPINELILSNSYRAAVTGFCKTISNNYAKDGITANCVCPGHTATERLADLARKRAEAANTTAKEVVQGIAEEIPARRIGEPHELASLIAFLASNRAAYITGSSIPVDGGRNGSLI